ncbi:MAG: hypothetical protein ACREHC_05750, partial [Candidatus Levyibacteriota bacterium]
MAGFYYTMVWVVVALLILILVLIGLYSYFYFIRNQSLTKKVEQLEKDLKYSYRLFEDHFKTTDQTIVDLRKERDELKKKHNIKE